LDGDQLMRKLWFLALLVFWPAQSKAADPYIVQRCIFSSTSNTTGSTIGCSLANTVAGNTIIVGGHDFGSSNTVTGTESFTCPSGAKAYYNTTQHHGAYVCYVATASPHATFNITSTLTCAPCGSIQQIEAFEVSGLGAVDTPSAAAALALTVNVTTANANEWIYCTTYDFATLPSPVSGSQIDSIQTGFPPTSQVDQLGAQFLIAGTAGSYTNSFNDTNSFPVPIIACLAFQTTGASTPSVRIVQGCTWVQSSGNPTPVACRLSNVVAGNKVIILAYTNAAGVVNVSGGCSPETCVCPTSAGASHTYATTFTGNICYGDMANSYSTLDVTLGSVGPGGAVGVLRAYEVSGLGAGIDAGSEAGAAATSVNFTTASNNEYAFFVAIDSGTNVLAPGSGFGQLSWSAGNTGSSSLGGYLLIATAGANTASYTQTGSSTPIIGVAAFGFTPAPTSAIKHKAGVI
jgi:hypothetical protein